MPKLRKEYFPVKDDAGEMVGIMLMKEVRISAHIGAASGQLRAIKRVAEMVRNHLEIPNVQVDYDTKMTEAEVETQREFSPWLPLYDVVKMATQYDSEIEIAVS